MKVHQISMNRGLKQSWVIFEFVPNAFHKLRKKSFYWKLGSFMGASWPVEGYELLEFLNKQTNLRNRGFTQFHEVTWLSYYFCFSTSISPLVVTGKNPLLMHLIPAVCTEETSS